MAVKFRHDNVEEACRAAKQAFLPWARFTMDERKACLLRLKEIFDTHAEHMAQVIARDTGKPLWDALTEAKALGNKIDITVNHSIKLIAEEHIANALPQVEGVVRHKPRGVMAVVGPFNFPAHLPNGHIIPALLAGNTVVYKPSEQTPAVAQYYTDLFEKAGFPPGRLQHGSRRRRKPAAAWSRAKTSTESSSQVLTKLVSRSSKRR